MNFTTSKIVKTPFLISGVFDVLLPTPLDGNYGFNATCTGALPYTYYDYPGQLAAGLRAPNSTTIDLPGWFDRVKLWLCLITASGSTYAYKPGSMNLIPAPLGLSPTFTIGMKDNSFFDNNFYPVSIGQGNNTNFFNTFISSPHGAMIKPLTNLNNRAIYFGKVLSGYQATMIASFPFTNPSWCAAAFYRHCQDSIMTYPANNTGEMARPAFDPPENERLCNIEWTQLSTYNAGSVFSCVAVCQEKRAEGVFNQIKISRSAFKYETEVLAAINDPCGINPPSQRITESQSGSLQGCFLCWHCEFNPIT